VTAESGARKHPSERVRSLTYADAGGTRPDLTSWSPPSGYRSFGRTVEVGRGPVDWNQASTALLSWGVKTRSGFRVERADGADPSGPVTAGADYWLVASFGPLRVREPARVVAVVDEPDRCGFAYGTLDGHPVSGEEAFLLTLTRDGMVRLTLRSLTRPGRGVWRVAFPLILVAQRWYRFRYSRALRQR
jgi:uncharacterized protein (UPF0548 family)